MRRRTKNVPMVRLSDKERLIVNYIVGQLERAYRNAAGKPVYARNMDQVMRDIFGIKKFCKTLQKARNNEAIMIELMKALDTETLWRICRSKEHYRLFCSLIAMDHQIVKMGKKLNAMADMEPTERPTRKIRKLMKELKRYRKMYKNCVSTMQDVFEIEKVTKRGDSMYDFMSDWLDRNDGDADFYDFDGYGMTFSESAIESMDEYVYSKTKARRQNGPRPTTGALDLGLDDERYPGYGAEFAEEEDDDEDDADYEEAYYPTMRKQQPRRGVDPDDKVDTLRNEISDMAAVISDGFERLNDSIGNLYDALANEHEEYYEEDMPMSNATHTPPKTIDEMVEYSTARNTGAQVVPETGEPDQNPPETESSAT